MVKNSRTLIWSSDAVWRLNRIYNWYSTFESTARAKKVLKSIQELAKNIPSNPHKYPQCLDIKIPTTEIRKALCSKTYWIVFEIEEKRIVILDIIHTAQSPEEYNKEN